MRTTTRLNREAVGYLPDEFARIASLSRNRRLREMGHGVIEARWKEGRVIYIKH